MCGIAGLIAASSKADLARDAQSMADRLVHRGPDDAGVWVDEAHGVALSHRRLSIIDLSAAGHQPMHSHCGRFVLVLNGEIYNHAALRAEVEAAGAPPVWRGHSDTETLLAAISRWGFDAALAKSSGMFAAALWDRQAKTLTLAIDRMGEKPLYWGFSGGRFAFGSEVHAIACLPSWNPRIDPSAVGQLLRYNYIPAPSSIYRGIEKLRPGHKLVVSVASGGAITNACRPVRWWRPENGSGGGRKAQEHVDPGEIVDRLEKHLEHAVGEQMVADVPVGAFLSGGIDSSTVVAVMQKLATRPVETFSIGFEDPTLNEAPHARLVADHLKTRHTELIVTDAEARALVPELASIYSEPFADASAIPTAIVCRLARERVTVALSGDGGDELFAGYTRYRHFERLSRVPAALRTVTALAAGLAPIPVANALGRRAGLPGLAGDRLRKLAEILPTGSGFNFYRGLVSHWQRPERIVNGLADDERAGDYADLLGDGVPSQAVLTGMAFDRAMYLPGDILAKVDRAAMAVALETRLPLLNHKLVGFADTLPLGVLSLDGRSKWPLRQVLYRHVPSEIVDRPKMGFAVPLAAWLRGPLREWAEELLSSRRLAEEGVFRPAPIREAWEAHLRGERNMHYRLWSVLMFQAWQENARRAAPVAV